MTAAIITATFITLTKSTPVAPTTDVACFLRVDPTLLPLRFYIRMPKSPQFDDEAEAMIKEVSDAE